MGYLCPVPARLFPSSMRWMRTLLIRRSLPVVVLLALAACVPAVRTPAAGAGGAAPAATVERFLTLAAASEYLEMGWVFGTDRGPVIRRDAPADVERRMFAIANVLQHERFAVRSQAPVPGRVGNAISLDVAITQQGREYVVPFTVVRGPGERWFVEQVRLEAITGRP
jgi:hypothetical protein